MQLIDYLTTCRGAAAQIARELGVSGPYVWQWASGKRKVPAEKCALVELLTGGRVSVGELRPDVNWLRLPDPTWPEENGRPCIDVARLPAAVHSFSPVEIAHVA